MRLRLDDDHDVHVDIDHDAQPHHSEAQGNRRAQISVGRQQDGLGPDDEVLIM